ncbi:MAG TPA: Ku protein [Thermodesulfovibrionales bacterium]|nr:Ku protein [Thermodesulfovibrionales bacterium]
MASGAIWKGEINFGNISVPVKLHTSIREERVMFHLLHKRDHVRLRQQMICAYDRQPVPADDQAKGFEVEEGKYVIVDPEELEETVPESSRVIEVHEFVSTGQISAVFLERVYNLEPDGRSKEYTALAKTLTEMAVQGVCTWTMRKRSYIGALHANGRLLRLSTLRYADEVVPAKALELERFSLSEKEIRIASDLINHLSGAFQPEKFKNEHQKKLQGLIDRKARGEKVVVLRPKRLKPTAPDKLLQALEASLKQVA